MKDTTHLSLEFITDKEKMLDAVRKNGYALANASNDLKADTDVVLAAVNQNNNSLIFACIELKNNPKFILHIAQKHGACALKYASSALKNNKKFILQLVKEYGSWVLQYLSPALQSDKEIFLAAVTQDGWALQFAIPALRADKDIVLAAVKQEGLALEFVSEFLRADPKIVLTAATQKIAALQYAKGVLKKHTRNKLIAAAQAKPQILSSITNGFFAHINKNSITLNQRLLRDSILAKIFFGAKGLYLQAQELIQCLAAWSKQKLPEELIAGILPYISPFHFFTTIDQMANSLPPSESAASGPNATSGPAPHSLVDNGAAAENSNTTAISTI